VEVRRDALAQRMLLAADILAFAMIFTLSVSLYRRPLDFESVTVSLIVLPVSLFWATLLGLYDRDEALLRRSTMDEVPAIFQLATLYTLVAWLTTDFLAPGALASGQVLLLWLALGCLLIATRITARSLALALSPAERCLFIGDEQTACKFRAKLEHHSGVNAAVVARIDFDELVDLDGQADDLGRIVDVRHLAQALDVQRAIVAPESADDSEALELVRTLKAANLRITMLPRLFAAVGPSVEFDNLHGMTVMGIKQFALGRSSTALKRAFDLTGALIGLVAVSPLMLAIAAAVKLDTRGPVFFRQRRVGRHGAHFEMLKFRTMVRDAESLKESLIHHNEALEGLFKISDDPRITRVGKLLRKASLDELPQLLNVLRGEMSLVGPRPLVIDEDDRVKGWQRQRLELPPGMTGQWQILGPVRTSLSEMITIDYMYVANWSLWTDITILLRTATHVAGRRGL